MLTEFKQKLMPAALAVLTLVACQKFEEKKADPDLIKLGIRADLKPTASAEKRAFADKVNRDELVSFKELTQLWAGAHEEYAFNKERRMVKRGDTLLQVEKLVANSERLSPDKADLPGFKATLLNSLADLHRGALKVNSDAVSLVTVLQEGKLQSYSGTSLIVMADRTRFSGLDYAGFNKVIIFTEGHVKPGYVKKDRNRYFLYGIETTLGGRTEVRYGETSKISGAMKVVDANWFAYYETFKYDFVNPALVADEMVKQTHVRYQLSPMLIQNAAAIEVRAAAGVGLSDEEKAKLHRSALRFGTITALPEGNIVGGSDWFLASTGAGPGERPNHGVVTAVPFHAFGAFNRAVGTRTITPYGTLLLGNFREVDFSNSGKLRVISPRSSQNYFVMSAVEQEADKKFLVTVLTDKDVFEDMVWTINPDNSYEVAWARNPSALIFKASK